jgi:hypothetical protein
MACRVFSDPKLFGGAQIIECGTLPKPKRCAFCGRRGVALCDWKTEKRVLLHPCQLREGDLYVTQNGRNLKILTLNRFRYEGKPLLWSLRPHAEAVTGSRVTSFAVDYGRNRHFIFFRVNRQCVPVLRRVLCSASCCDRCRRHVGPNKDYCRDHWSAWEMVS